MEKIKDKEFGVGIDVTNINFFNNKTSAFVKRILTTNEYQEYLKIDINYRNKFLASRWALKEAAFKAINEFHNIFFTQIEFIKNINGSYTCLTFKNLKVSISYNEDLVYAIAIYRI